jgi:hypothetical protein
MPVLIENNIDSPKIVLDEEKSIFLIEGSSYMADAYKAYKIVLDWINEKFTKCDNHVVCEFKFNMLSSASRKMIFEILSAINQNSSGNKDVQIHWYYSDYDEDMKEIGEVYAEQIQLPFSFHTM